MFNFQPFLSKISGGIDTAAEWFYRFKKTKGFRLTALSLENKETLRYVHK